MPGIVLEKAFVEAKGKKFGTPGGRHHVHRPVQARSPGSPANALTAVRNDAYWDTALKPKAAEIDFKGVPDDSSLTSGLLTGEIGGSYPLPLTTLDQLKASTNVNVYAGPSFASDAFIVSSLKGALGDVQVRQALSMAIDRQAYINTLYTGCGAAARGRWPTRARGATSATCSRQDWDALPEPTRTSPRRKAAGQGGRRDRQDDRASARRSEINSLQHRRERGPPGGRSGDRPEGEAQVGLGRQLHQLLHRPEGPRGRRRVPHRQLPRLRRPGRALQHVRRQRTAPRTTTASTTREITKALERRAHDGRPAPARAS